MNQPKFKKLANFTEKMMFPMIFIGPLFSLPQVYNVWFESKDGVSLISWITYFITQIFWLFHAFNLKDKQNIATGTLWLVVEFLISSGSIPRRLRRSFPYASLKLV